MPRILEIDGFAVYIYAESSSPHRLPHCHVRKSGATTVLALPSLTVLAGKNLPRRIILALRARMSELAAAWDEHNTPSKMGE